MHNTITLGIPIRFPLVIVNTTSFAVLRAKSRRVGDLSLPMEASIRSKTCQLVLILGIVKLAMDDGFSVERLKRHV